jgi:hypothetical protein
MLVLRFTLEERQSPNLLTFLSQLRVADLDVRRLPNPCVTRENHVDVTHFISQGLVVEILTRYARALAQTHTHPPSDTVVFLPFDGLWVRVLLCASVAIAVLREQV